MVICQGTVKNGVVVPENDVVLPEGAAVRIEIGTVKEPHESLRQMLLRYAGWAEDLPADFAAEHDHYIHGTPKRSGR